MSLLSNDKALIVPTRVAKEIGLDNAVVLNQINYWLQYAKTEHDGKMWVYKTIDGWVQQDFPFFEPSKLQRIFTKLKKMGLIDVEKLASRKNDQTNYYTINKQGMDNLEREINKKDPQTLTAVDSANMNDGTSQNAMMDDNKMRPSIITKCDDASSQNAMMSNKNTKEINKEITAVNSNQVSEAQEVPKQQQIDFSNDWINDFVTTKMMGSIVGMVDYINFEALRTTMIENRLYWESKSLEPSQLPNKIFRSLLSEKQKDGSAFARKYFTKPVERPQSTVTVNLADRYKNFGGVSA